LTGDNSPSGETDDSAGVDDDATVDFYGNKVTSAVAQYKLDSSGSLYDSPLLAGGAMLLRLMSGRRWVRN